MKPYYAGDLVQLHHGDCLDALSVLPDDSVDACVTDPPYELGFMGKKWDAMGIAYDVSMWADCLRILKPGGHLLSFGGSRTWHRLAAAVEDAGFEIRDSIAWLYGSGFPKSLDVSKAIDKAAGAEREVVGLAVRPDGSVRDNAANWSDGMGYMGNPGSERSITAPATDAAQQWQGWGTALKPAFEPIVVGRKPFSGTVAGNVLEHGTGALNIDACRIEAFDSQLSEKYASVQNAGSRSNSIYGADSRDRAGAAPHTAGRWPTNVALDESQAAELDEQAGVRRAGERPANRAGVGFHGGASGTTSDRVVLDSGGASRFFPVFRYQAKAPAKERPKVDGVGHPTVKPLELMRWLDRFVQLDQQWRLDRPVILRCTARGTAGEACVLEGFRCLLIEREADYLPLIVERLGGPVQPRLDFDGAAS